MKLKLLIVDDHAIVRDGLAVLLNLQKDFAVVGQAVNGKEAARLAGELRPDVVLMDLMMPGQDGADATATLLEACPQAKVLLLTTYGTSARLAAAFENGATGAVTKTSPVEELYAAIRDTAAGKRVLSEEIRQTLAEASTATMLTPRQLQMLVSLQRGLTNYDIAREYDLSYSAVKFHLKNLFAKLGVANRAEAVALAMSKHLLKA